MTFIPHPQEIYKHFKGNLYQIVTIAEHSETGEQLVVYQAMYGDFKIYARPLSMFTEEVDRTKYPEVTQQYRFELQGPKRSRQFTQAAWAEPLAPEAEQVAPAAETIASETETIESTLESEEPNIDPMVLEFLDADSYEQKLNILAALHHRITGEMLTTMAIATDIEIGEGDLETRYDSLKSCLQTLEKYECNRLR